MVPFIISFCKITSLMGLLIVGLLLGAAYLTYFERKLIGAIQLRKGPNTVGFFGLLQPLADVLKLFSKEHIIPHKAEKTLFLIAPFFTLIFALSIWVVIPIDKHLMFIDLNMGLLYIVIMMGFSMYGIFIAGWASRSTYALLGTIRALAQLISYELVIGLVLLAVVLWGGTFNLSGIVKEQEDLWFIVPLFPFFLAFLIAGLAKCQRVPFDLPHAKSELGAGYAAEYSSLSFSFFFLAEYLYLLFFSAFTTILFLGGWQPLFTIVNVPGYIWFFLKMGIILFLTIVIQATLPRLRYDQLMSLCWKILIPSLGGGILLLGIAKIIVNL